MEVKIVNVIIIARITRDDMVFFSDEGFKFYTGMNLNDGQ